MPEDPTPRGDALRRSVIGVVWIVAVAIFLFGPAEWLADRIEGIDAAVSPKGPLIAGIIAILIACLVTVVAWPPRRKAGVEIRSRRRALRIFLTASAALGAAVGAIGWRIRGWLTITRPAILVDVVHTDPSPQESWKVGRIRDYRRLGRTGFLASDISLGSGPITEENDGEEIAREAIDRGVNYFDTAPDYSGSGSERALGRALRGRRDRMFVATKFCTPEGHLPAGASVADYMRVVEGSLERLQTDWVDLVHIHSCDSLERLLDSNVHEAFDRLREQGKARFLGVSTHTPNLEQVANAAIDSDRFDVLMLAYHHGAWPKLDQIVQRASERDLGVVAMKTLKGAKHRGLHELRDAADSYSQSAFRWVLSNPSVACLVISFFERQHLDEYLFASGKRLTPRNLALLRRYDELIAGKYCFPHCGRCLEACPESVPIHDVLRYRMYDEDYGWPSEAKRLYAKLDRQGDRCLGCAAPCSGACPAGISIRERIVETHFRLTA